jgi:hypothetical protein
MLKNPLMKKAEKKTVNWTILLTPFLVILFITSCHKTDSEVLTPTITGFTPSSGVVGSTVFISGTNFSTTLTNNVVAFNGTSASVTAANATQLTVTVPIGATTGKIALTVNSITVNSTSDFTVTTATTGAPTIASFSPTSGVIGTTVIITGTNFSTTPSNNTVLFNGVLATVSAATATQLTTLVPSGATTGKISVTVNSNTTVATSTTDFTVTTSTGTDCSGAAGIAKIVCLANAFKATLSKSQLATLQLDYTFARAKTWSNLPASMSARIGIQLGSLSATQLAAAKKLIKAITSTTVNEGYDEVQQVWAADDYLNANGGGSAYGSGNYYLAFLGTPSETGTFEILETGHHKTVANTYINGVLVGATPHFAAVEPVSFTSGSSTIAPISQERDAFVAFLASLSSTQLTAAKSTSTFTDLVLTPGKEWQFPTTFTGLQGNSLSSEQKQLLINVIKTYTNDIDDANAAVFLATYTADLDNTYVLYSGTTSVNSKNDYFRIAGPKVWIEFIVAGGIVFPSSVHFHSVWRDRLTDYGGTKQ